VDAANDSDLHRLACAIAVLGPRAIAVGSAGLARQIAALWKPEGSSTDASGPRQLAPCDRVLVIVTSQTPAARRQAAALAHAGAAVYEPTLDDVVEAERWSRWSDRVRGLCATGNETVVLAAPSDRKQSAAAALIPMRFAELAAHLQDGSGRRVLSPIWGVAVTGGDGARALVNALGATAIRICGEVMRGVPFGTLCGGAAPGLAVVTKSGGFGDAETLVRAVQTLRDGSCAWT
jgi:uncharacterized protein YgbK (DUF1537 family)